MINGREKRKFRKEILYFILNKLDKENEFPFDIDVRKNFKRILRAARQAKVDHLVVSGDLCFDVGDVKIYEWIRDQLDLTRIPYDVIGGNHDDLFLDSSKGFHSENQLKWLDRQLKNGNENFVIFTHHPPVKAGVLFMDKKYPLQNIPEIQEVLFGYRGFVNIFCGHFHVEKTIQRDNILVQITPSTFYQLDQNYEDFKVDHHSIAYRLIDISSQSLKTSVKYFRGSKK